MYVRSVSRPGIPRARVAVSNGQTDLGAHQVTINISALDAYDVPAMVASLRLSKDEALDLASRIIAQAMAQADKDAR